VYTTTAPQLPVRSISFVEPNGTVWVSTAGSGAVSITDSSPTRVIGSLTATLVPALNQPATGTKAIAASFSLVVR
jgi:hypothetical protein